MTTDKYILYKYYSRFDPETSKEDFHKMFSAEDDDRNLGFGGAGIMIVNSEKEEFLLFRRSSLVNHPLKWNIPGGKRKKEMNSLEPSLYTAIKKAEEEMGELPVGKIRTEPIKYTTPEKHMFTFKTYILEADTKYLHLIFERLSGETTESQWMNKENALKNNLHPGLRTVIEQYEF